MTILIGYASTHGSTQGIAQQIGGRLKERGYDAEVRAMGQIQDVSVYNAVVLGSAVHNRAWLPEAIDFVDRNLLVLGERPVWLFSVGMLGDTGSTFAPVLARLLRRLQKDRKEIAGFRDFVHPREHRVFVGVLQRDHLSLIGHLIFKAMGGRYGDQRDWTEINAWADSIAHQLPVSARATLQPASVNG